MANQLTLTDEPTTQPPAVPIKLAVSSLRALLEGNEDADGEIDRIALRMGIDALKRLEKTRAWVRGYGQKYTGEEMAALADLVEEIGGKSDEVRSS